MSVVQASCPSCGAPITFKRGSSLVVVCEYCRSAVARGDRNLEDLGKVAELIETSSPLQVGLRGAYQNISFELTGRAQLGHEAGGMWDEWYATFSDGRTGWLAEAQGRFYLTFQRQLNQQSTLPPYEHIQPGQPGLTLGAVTLIVAEKGVATSLGAQGEIPYKLVPGARHAYADLSGPRGEFATIDFSDFHPLLFIGREVTLAELGLQNAAAPQRQARRVEAHQLNCPHCAGRLDLRAPDQTQRVTCPNCGSLLDVNQGNLKFLRALDRPPVVPIIPIGSVGNFPIGKMMVIGFMQRSVTFDGVRYFWEEYLLYEPTLGFRWLTRSDDHWSFVQTLAPGMVADEGNKARFADRTYKIFQSAGAKVEYVAGEFYWKVAAGESVRADDYIRPPEFLSCEKNNNEINWSLGTYLPSKDVEQAFGLKDFPRPSGVAPNQPFLHKYVYKYWMLTLVAIFLLGIFGSALTSSRTILHHSFTLEPRKTNEETQTFFTEPFELKSRQNIQVEASAQVSNSWVYFEGDFVNEETGLVQPFSMPIEYYFGNDSGESWSEGGTSAETYLSSVPGGKYVLRIEAQWEKWSEPQMLTVKVTQNVARPSYIFLAMLLASIIPICVAIYHYSFEKRRWQDSEFNPYAGSDE